MMEERFKDDTPIFFEFFDSFMVMFKNIQKKTKE